MYLKVILHVLKLFLVIIITYHTYHLWNYDNAFNWDVKCMYFFYILMKPWVHLSYDLVNEDLNREDLNVHLTTILSEKHAVSEQITFMFLQIGSCFRSWL